MATEGKRLADQSQAAAAEINELKMGSQDI
jgi:hypothetical protein